MKAFLTSAYCCLECETVLELCDERKGVLNRFVLVHVKNACKYSNEIFEQPLMMMDPLVRKAYRP